MKAFLLGALVSAMLIGGASAACYPMEAKDAAVELLENETLRAALEREEELGYVREQTCWLMTEYGELLETDYAGMLSFSREETTAFLEIAEKHGTHHLLMLAAAEELLAPP